MIVFATEKWADIYPELAPLLVQHWQEIASNHDRIPLDVAYDRYLALCEAGVLHVLSARADGKLVGYHVALVTGHLHYQSTLHCITDVYYLVPQYRKVQTGIELFREVERQMKARGVVKLFTGVKLHTHDGKTGKLFEFLGYTHTENLYMKLI